MKTNRHLIISGILFTVVLFLWPIFMGISQPQGNETEQLFWIQENLILYKIQFFLAFLISPSIIYLMVSQLEKFQHDNKISSKIGWIFLTAYFVLNSISYSSQMIVVPRLMESGLIEQASVWYFGSSSSVAYFMNQLGYCFWGIGTLILFVRLIRENGMIKYLSIIYSVSAILSIIAFIGLIIDNDRINSLTLYGGLVLVPVGIITIIWGQQEIKKIRLNGTEQGV